jgi:hypothetical protein
MVTDASSGAVNQTPAGFPRLEHRDCHVDDRGACLGAPRRSLKLVVRPETVELSRICWRRTRPATLGRIQRLTPDAFEWPGRDAPPRAGGAVAGTRHGSRSRRAVQIPPTAICSARATSGSQRSRPQSGSSHFVSRQLQLTGCDLPVWLRGDDAGSSSGRPGDSLGACRTRPT